MSIEDVVDFNQKSILFESRQEHDENYSIEIKSLYTFYVWRFWKKLYFENYIDSDTFTSDPEDESNKLTVKRQISTLWSLAYITLVIILVITFQFIAIISLEFNLYNITYFQTNLALSNNNNKMKELHDLNSLKEEVAPFKVTLSELQENMEVQVPGAFLQDNFSALRDTINVEKTYANYLSNGLRVYPFPDQIRPQPIFEQNTSSSLVTLYTNPNGNDLTVSVPIMVKDSQDLKALSILNPDSYEIFVNEMIKMDFIQEKHSTQEAGSFDLTNQYFTSTSTLTEISGDSQHQFYDFNILSENIQTKQPCLVTPVSSNFSVKLPRNKDFIINNANPSICNHSCLITSKNSSLNTTYEYQGQELTMETDGNGSDFWREKCQCQTDTAIDSIINNLESDSINVCRSKSGISLRKTARFVKFDDFTQGFGFEPNQYNFDQDKHGTLLSTNTDQTVLNSWSHPNLSNKSLAGIFVYPVIINKQKNCDSDVNIDFRGDLLAYPIVVDSYNQNKQFVDQGFINFWTAGVKQYELLTGSKKFNITKSTDEESLTFVCSNMCLAQDFFLINNHDYELSSSNSVACQCMMNNVEFRSYTGLAGIIEARPDVSTIQSFPNVSSFAGISDGVFYGYTFKFQLYQNIDSKDGTSNQIIGNMLSKMSNTSLQTAIRIKTVILPKINHLMQCQYTGVVSISIFNNNEFSLSNIPISSISPLQYSRVITPSGKVKSLYICTPDIQSFEKNQTVYPQFDKYFTFNQSINKDVSQQFGSLTAGEWEGCPIDDLVNLTNNQSELSQDEIDKANKANQAKSWTEFFEKNESVLPRSQGYSKNNMKLEYSFYTDQKMSNTDENIIRSKTYITLVEFQNQNLYQNMTMLFCYMLVLLSIFDESNECLFVIYTSSRVFYVQMYYNKDNNQQIIDFVMQTISMWTSIFRIGILTQKIVMVTFLMNWNVTIDTLLMNSLALIFILEMDSISYGWLFDKEKGNVIECRNFLNTFFRIKIIFNLWQQITIIGCIYFSFVGIYTFENQFSSLWNMISDGDLQALTQTFCQLVNFGQLVNECSSKLYEEISFKTRENNYKLIIFIQICIQFSVQSVFIIFIYTDYSFQYYDQRMCLKTGNLNCNNNQKISSEVFTQNLSRVLQTIIIIIGNILQQLFKQIQQTYQKNQVDESENQIRISYNITSLFSNNKNISSEELTENDKQTFINEDLDIESRFNNLEFSNKILTRRINLISKYKFWTLAEKAKKRLNELKEINMMNKLIALETQIECEGNEFTISPLSLRNIYQMSINAYTEFKNLELTIDEALNQQKLIVTN